MRVILDLTAGLSYQNVTCNSFFTSNMLAEELLKRKPTMLGTMRKNMPELPKELNVNKNRNVT